MGTKCINTEMGPFNAIEEINTDHSTMTRANMLSILLSTGSQCVSLSHTRCGRQQPDHVRPVASAGVPSHDVCWMNVSRTPTGTHSPRISYPDAHACGSIGTASTVATATAMTSTTTSNNTLDATAIPPALIFKSLEKGVRSQVVRFISTWALDWRDSVGHDFGLVGACGRACVLVSVWVGDLGIVAFTCS
jgi:hypothetical protein